jgi:hypothetical protein
MYKRHSTLKATLSEEANIQNRHCTLKRDYSEILHLRMCYLHMGKYPDGFGYPFYESFVDFGGMNVVKG